MMINNQRGLWSLCCLPVLCVAVLSAPSAGDTVVTFPALGLETEVRSQLGMAPSVPITSADMLQLKALNAPFADIADLAGMEYAANLGILSVHYNLISDLQPLAGLGGIYDLTLYGNRIADVSPLAGLGALRSLILGDNLLNNVGPLRQLTALTDLDLSCNEIADVSSLATLTKLEFLDLSANHVVDISFLTGLAQMRALGLKDNEVSDIGPLSGLTHLTVLDLRGNPLDAVAYSTFIPEILANNPGIDLMYDPVPEPGTCGLLGLGAVLVLRKLGKTRTMSCKGDKA